MDKKVERIINLYSRLMEGEVINKNKEAFRFGVNERTILRDIDDIRAYLANDMDVSRQLVYDRSKWGYRLECDEQDKLTGKEILTVCKVFLESHALVKEELLPIVDKLLLCCASSEERKRAVALIANEKFHYENPKHEKLLGRILWDIAGAVYEHRLMQICYQNPLNHEVITKIIQPAGIVFSETSFYLTAYISEQDEIASSTEFESKEEVNKSVEETTFSTVYCVNQIVEYEVLSQHFHVPYGKRFAKEKM
ncbi:MAG: WYL domain-containing protein [Lachnospiraceae bacterium]|nr:WYL domain-containing protein [Lachnospiraceae bacterium]